jgi:uncharacterized membrane protein YfcA
VTLDAKTPLLVALGLFGLGFAGIWIASLRRKTPGDLLPRPGQGALGFVTNFFDTLGIGSFAPTTAAFKLWRMVPDELIPGTLNVGHTLPVMVMAFIFVAVIEVDLLTLVSMIAASVVGGWIGAGVVSDLPRRRIQVGVAVALLLAAGFFVMTNLGAFPGGGEARVLSGWRLGLAVAVSFVLGGLNALGIGFYAPCMTLVSLLGMNPQAAFPIMMGSCAFLMPAASARFIRKGSYSARPALGLALGGVPAVLIAALVVRSLPVTALRWLVVFVVLYAAVLMLRSAAAEGRAAHELESAD